MLARALRDRLRDRAAIYHRPASASRSAPRPASWHYGKIAQDKKDKDASAHAYLEKLADPFIAAGCNIEGSGFDTGISANAKGLFVAAPGKNGQVPSADAVSRARRLQAILKQAGLTAELAIKENIPEGQVQIIVGGKPQ